jgi:hypothetical protein
MEKFVEKKESKPFILPFFDFNITIDGFSFFIPIAQTFKPQNCSVMSFHTNEINFRAGSFIEEFD